MQSALAQSTRTAPHHNLRAIFSRRGFRHLLLVRLLSQVGDGWFQAGLASSVFFNPERAASPLAITSAFAVLLLPYSTLGPFIGVFLDRWSRRNTLFLANLCRAVLVLPAAVSVWYGREDLIFLSAALGVIALNRFFLAGMAASLPHVVEEERLVTANSFASTAGTVVYSLSIGSAGFAFQVVGAKFHSYATVAVCAAGMYALAAVLTLGSFRPDALGPDDAERPSTTVRGALMDSARGLVAGLRHLAHRPAASSMLLMQAGHRALYGVLGITTLVLYRNYYNSESAEGAITGLLPVAAAAAGGSLLAAVITPPLTRHIGGWRYLTATTAALAVLVPAFGLTYIEVLTVAAAFVVSLAAQATKIVTDTTLQVEVDDDFRGRVFSVNDTGFNLMFVLGLLIGALVMPSNGYSPVLMVAAGAGYALLALWFGMTSSHGTGKASARPS
jgi:MFS family permease